MSGLNVNWEQIGEVLVLLFVISVVFETALTPIFNWRIFARFCEGKGVKTPFTVIVAVLLLWTYEIDIFRHIIDAFDAAKGAAATGTAGAAGVQGTAGSESSFLGRIMTGLLVAGGSGAIFNIFTKMGLRNPMQLAEKAQKARGEADKAKKAKQAADQGQQQGGRAGEPPVGG